jgi:hypothetical protein
MADRFLHTDAIERMTIKVAPADIDGCEWNPERDGLAFVGDRHTRENPATVLVGGRENYRLCDGCAALPRFKRLRKRRPIRRDDGR